MRYPLCVLTPEIGVLSETFIAWDINELASDRTVAVADPPPRGATVLGTPAWSTDAPTLRFEPVPADPPPSPERNAEFADFVRQHRVEVVLVEFLDFAERWFDLLTQLGVRTWLRGHGADISGRLTPSYRRFATADGIIVPSRSAADRLAALGLSAQRLHVVPSHVAVPARRPPQRDTDPAELRCISVGRLVPKKGHRYLVDAFAGALPKAPQLKLDIIGDGPLHDDLARQIDRAGLDRKVRLIGSLPPRDISQRLQEADLFVHHAVTADDGDAEGQPLAILEAMAAGVPTIATRHEGIPDVIDDTVNGRLVDERDAHATAAILVELAHDQAQRHRLAVAGWQHVQQGHSHQAVRARLLDLLDLSDREPAA